MPVKCPSCGHENIAGNDRCENCAVSLSQSYMNATAGKGKFRRMIMEETVWNAIDQGQKPILLDVNDTAEKAIRLFQEQQQSCLLVLENGALTGIVTYRDILLKVAGKYKDFKRLKVSQIMTQRPVSLHKDDTVAVAINRMSVGGFRHLPIVDDENHPVGWISIKAVLRHLSKTGLAAASGTPS